MKVVEALFSSNAVLFDVIYAKGYQIPIYLDIRKTLSHPVERSVVINNMQEVFTNCFSNCEMIAGTCTAGIPYAAILAQNLNLPMCYVRPQRKNKGLGNQIEGDIYKPNLKTVIIEDVVAHANSIVTSADALRRENASILGAISIFSFNMNKAIETLDTSQIKHISLCAFEEVINLAIRKGLVFEKDREMLYEYRDNTPEYAWD